VLYFAFGKLSADRTHNHTMNVVPLIGHIANQDLCIRWDVCHDMIVCDGQRRESASSHQSYSFLLTQISTTAALD
jgi:hypothetical protein